MKVVAYYRVSTTKQGASGLGLEAQRVAVNAYRGQHNAEMVAEFVEVESGKRSDRPQLAKALAKARRSKATLVIAKLDRLARNVHFVSGLMESSVDFVCCDNPNANRLTIHILSAVAEDEARRIGERTKAALAAYKARGGKLGAELVQCRNLSPAARRRGAAATKAKAEVTYGPLLASIKAWRAEGLTLDAVADRLNDRGHATTAGLPFSSVAVWRILRRTG